jgi:hypothetical protein
LIQYGPRLAPTPPLGREGRRGTPAIPDPRRAGGHVRGRAGSGASCPTSRPTWPKSWRACGSSPKCRRCWPSPRSGAAPGCVQQPGGRVRPAVLGLLPGLDAYVFSYEVGLAKPDPAIFQRVCDALGCAPGEVVFVGTPALRRGRPARSACRPGTWTGGGQSLLDVLADVLLTSDQLASIGSAYDALRANPDRGVSAASVRARLAAAGGQEPTWPASLGQLIR